MIVLTLVIFTISNLFGITTCGSIYMIGTRQFDQDEEILVVDVLKSEPSRISTNHSIKFEYVINGLISYIELSSQSNVEAEILLTYDELLRGSATAINEFQFELKIKIYGFKKNKIPINFQPVMGKDSVLVGELQPTSNDIEPEYFVNYDYSDYNNVFDDYFKEIGSRGLSDILLYEEMKHSQSTEYPTNHSIVFYYIDSTFITDVKVIGILTEKPSIKYSHFSDSSIKATVTDYNVLSLSAKFEVYGYNSDSKPSNFESRLPGPHIKLNFFDEKNIQHFECSKNNGISFQNSNCNYKFSIISVFLLFGLKLFQF